MSKCQVDRMSIYFIRFGFFYVCRAQIIEYDEKCMLLRGWMDCGYHRLLTCGCGWVGWVLKSVSTKLVLYCKYCLFWVFV